MQKQFDKEEWILFFWIYWLIYLIHLLFMRLLMYLNIYLPVFISSYVILGFPYYGNQSISQFRKY